MRIFMERYTGLEPATSTLARLRSTRWANTAKKWRLRWDSNPRPPPWQGGVLTNWTTKPFLYSTAKNAAFFKKWWELQGSNLWHPACKADALPAELNSHTFWSGWQDSNLRPSGPKPDALPNCATSRRMFSAVLLSPNDLYIIAKIFNFVNLDYSRLCLFFANFTFVFSFLRSFSTLFIFFIKL